MSPTNDAADDTADDITLAVLLAAGGGSRFAGPTHKLFAGVGEDTVVGAAVRHVLDARIGAVVVVSGAVDLADVVADTVGESDPSITVLHNPAWADGQATSLQVAVAEATRRGVAAIVVGLADQPFVDPHAWRLVAASESPIAVATYDAGRRNPVRLHRSIWPLLPATGDEGARSIIRLRPELVEEISCPGSAADIDTLEDLESWQNRSSTNSP